MRIVFLAGRDARHPLAGGGDVQAWAWARWCVDNGHEVTYVGQSHPSLPAVEDCDGVRVVRPGAGAALAWAARRMLRSGEIDADLVYEDPIGSGRIPYVSPLWARRPVVAVWHQVSGELLRELHPLPVAMALSGVEKVLARCYRRADLWVPSQERKDEIVQQLRLSPERLHVIAPTVDPGWAVRAGGPGSAAGGRRPQVLHLGVLRRYKATDHLVRAWPAVLARVPGAALVIAGRSVDPDYEGELRALVHELGIDGSVRFLGSVSEDEKHELMRTSRVLVLPSRLEGFGIVTLEANAVGTPVVASSGVPLAAVEHEVNGLRHVYGDVAGLGDAVVRVLADDALASRLSRTSVERVGRFVPEVAGRKFEALLETAAGRAR